MRKYNIPITTRKTASKDADKRYRDKTWLAKQLKAGKSIFQIAKDWKISYSSVRNPVLSFGLGDGREDFCRWNADKDQCFDKIIGGSIRCFITFIKSKRV